MEAVSLQKVVKSYRRGKETVEVLSGLDLEVAEGEFLAIMGPSGSGKTTALNLIGGLDHPDGGSVTVCGERIDQLSNAALARWRARHIGFVFELPLLLTGLDRAERRRHVAVALQLVGLSDRGRHRPNELSGGQQQRVAIARALVADPSLLVCDEPTGDLDRHTADEILGLLQSLNRQQGKTVIMVTHDQKAANFASRQVHVDKGMLIEAAAAA